MVMIQQAKKFISEFNNSQFATSTDNTSSKTHMYRRNSKENSKWVPPPLHTWTLNTDASWSSSHQLGGLGWVVRSWTGEVIYAGNKVVDNCWSVKMLEMEAVLEGLRWLENRPTPFPICDSIEVAQILNEQVDDFSEIQWLVDEIKRLKELK